MAIGTTTAALIGAGATLGGAALSSKGARSAASQQRQAAREQAASQERIAERQMQMANRLYGEQQAQMFPRQSASNRALAQASAMLGLGDIYAAPEAGSLGGGGQFYPRAPFTNDGAPNTGTAPGNNMFGQGPTFADYVQMNPDLVAAYPQYRSGGFGASVTRNYDANRNGTLDRDEFGRLHYEKHGRSEGRELPEGLFF